MRALSDDTGATVIRHDYLPFGEDTQPLTGDPMRFAGKELDPESAQMNVEARYYRNTWGRFTQVDPVHVEAALLDPQQWNRYAYARNNPLAYGDPSGENVIMDLFAPGSAATAALVAAGPWAAGIAAVGAFGKESLGLDLWARARGRRCVPRPVSAKSRRQPCYWRGAWAQRITTESRFN